MDFDSLTDDLQTVYNRPLLVLDISKVDSGRQSKDRSRSADRCDFRLHVLFGKDHGVIDFHRKKDWVFDSELQITRSRYLDLIRMFKESLEGIEHRPHFVAFASNILFSRIINSNA